MEYTKKIVFVKSVGDNVIIHCTPEEERKVKNGLKSTKPGAIILFPKSFKLKYFANCIRIDFEDGTWWNV